MIKAAKILKRMGKGRARNRRQGHRSLLFFLLSFNSFALDFYIQSVIKKDDLQRKPAARNLFLFFISRKF
jgi:hypothetical protein